MKKEVERNKELLLMHRDFPSLSYSQLGFTFNISKQRVHQIIRDNTEKPQDKQEGGLLGKVREYIKRLF